MIYKDKQQYIIDTIRYLSNYFNNVSEAISAPYDLSPLQTYVIIDVYENPKETKITDICKRLNKNTNTISPIVNKLISKGFLIKIQSKEDGRVFNVKLTDKSLSIINSIKIDVKDFTYPIFDGMDDEKLDRIYKSLYELKEMIEKWNI